MTDSERLKIAVEHIETLMYDNRSVHFESAKTFIESIAQPDAPKAGSGETAREFWLARENGTNRALIFNEGEVIPTDLNVTKVREVLPETQERVPEFDRAESLNAFINAVQYVDVTGNRDAQLWNAAVDWAWNKAWQTKGAGAK